MVLAPTFGERGSFVPLGLAQLNAVLRQAEYTASYHDLSEWLRREDPELYGELVKIARSERDAGVKLGVALSAATSEIVSALEVRVVTTADDAVFFSRMTLLVAAARQQICFVRECPRILVVW